MKHTAIYGGSFNPPTLGHQKVIEGVYTQTAVEKIILAPDGYRDDKNYQIGKNQREDMIHIFYETLKINFPSLILNTHFLEPKNGDNTTTIAVDKYFKELLGYAPSHIFGSDVIESMPSWVGNKDRYIEDTLKKIFISRPGYECDTHNLSNYIVADIKGLLEISSSLVKEIMQQKGTISHLLSPQIHEYIQQNNCQYF